MTLIKDTLGVVNQLGNSFLCFLSPYLLQTWLEGRVNIGGRPGANLTTTLYASTALSISAVVFARILHPNFWALRKLGNAISSQPVIRTLKSFNIVTTHGGRHEGRGTIISQTLMVVEYWFAVGNVMCMIGFILNRGEQEKNTQLDELWSAFRQNSFILDWTRILAHSVFMNQFDEMCLASPQPPRTPSRAPNSEDNNKDDDSKELVAFLPK